VPTYQYSCTECGHFFEQFQSFSDDSLTTCPECSGKLRKVFNAVGVVFKGSGFYRTDSRAGSGSGDGSGGGNGSGSGKDSTGSKDAGGKDAGSKGAGSGKESAPKAESSSKSSSSESAA
jgi:putative FmdB family regulatory protein